MIRTARFLAAGQAGGIAVVLSEPLCFFGGVDTATGDIIDHSHADFGRNVTGSILVMPGGRGSSSSSAVLAELIRMRTGPAGIVLGVPDPIMVVGSLVAESLYGISCPILVCGIEGIENGAAIRIVRGDDGLARLQLG